MARRLWIGLMLAILLPAGCTSSGTIEAPASETPGSVDDAGEMDRKAQFPDGNDPGEAHGDSRGDSSERLPGKISGEAEDERLSVRIFGEIEPDRGHYKTSIRFRNKTGEPLDILFDCGLPVSRDRFAPKEGICAAVESMLLKGSGEETLTATLDAAFFDTEEKLVTVRYRDGGQLHELMVGMQSG